MPPQQYEFKILLQLVPSSQSRLGDAGAAAAKAWHRANSSNCV